MPQAPDYFEPLIGWRAWLVVETRGGLRLSSVLYPSVWTPREEHVATCRPVHLPAGEPVRPAVAAPHEAPDARCGCGIYASKEPDRATSYVHGHAGGSGGSLFRVMGTVSLWGKVIETEHGYRASHAYPVRLYIPVNRIHGTRRVSPAAVAYELMSTYGVEVEPAAIPRGGSGPIVRTLDKRTGADGTAAVLKP